MNPHTIMSYRETGCKNVFKQIDDSERNEFEKPYRRLLMAVMIQCIDDLKLEIVVPDNPMLSQQRRVLHNQVHYRRAVFWFKSKRKHVMSFLNICEILGFNPDAVRRKVLL